MAIIKITGADRNELRPGLPNVTSHPNAPVYYHATTDGTNILEVDIRSGAEPTGFHAERPQAQGYGFDKVELGEQSRARSRSPQHSSETAAAEAQSLSYTEAATASSSKAGPSGQSQQTAAVVERLEEADVARAMDKYRGKTQQDLFMRFAIQHRKLDVQHMYNSFIHGRMKFPPLARAEGFISLHNAEEDAFVRENPQSLPILVGAEANRLHVEHNSLTPA